MFLIFLNVSYLVWMLAFSDGKKNQVIPVVVSQSGSNLRLLSELSSAERAGLIPKEDIQVAASEVLVELGTPYCASLGPFETRASAENAIGHIARSGLSSELRTVVLETGERYRVYLPSFKNYDAASSELRKLRAKKIDSYIMQDEGFSNAISLGIFSSRDGAEGLQKKMNAYGFQTLIFPTVYGKEAYWVDVKDALDGGKTDSVLIEAMLSLENITRIDSPCKVIALNK